MLGRAGESSAAEIATSGQCDDGQAPKRGSIEVQGLCSPVHDTLYTSVIGLRSFVLVRTGLTWLIYLCSPPFGLFQLDRTYVPNHMIQESIGTDLRPVHDAYNDSQPGDWTFMMIMTSIPDDSEYDPSTLNQS